MRKLFTLALAVSFVWMSADLNAQTPRVGLVEEATQASCPPCATLNPGLQDLMNANSDKVIFMAYQVWWPGFDQMYLDNEEDVDDRVGNYYDFGFAPQVKYNGAFPGGGDGSVGTLTQTVLDDGFAEMSEFDLNVSAEYVDGMLNVTGNVTGTMDATGTFKLHLVLTEGTIYATQAPGGTNGETEYHHVMKSFLPGTAGITLSDTWASGDTYTIDESYDISGLTIYNFDDLEVIAFIQNDDDKFIHQATKDGDVDIVLSFANNGGVAGVAGIPDGTCSSSAEISPVVTVQNTGNDDLTSLEFTYDINGGTPQTYTWNATTPVSSLGTADVELPAYSFTTMSPNTLNVEISNPNGMTDENMSDNMLSENFELAEASQAEEVLTLTINSDCWPQEYSWELKSVTTGTTIASVAEGDYNGLDLQEITEEITAPAGDCYEFIFNDAYGDGLNGSQWGSCGVDGNVTLQDGQGNVVYSNDGSTEFTSESELFNAVPVGLNENTLVRGFNVYPNPVVDQLTMSFNLLNRAYTTIDVTNSVGQVVSSKTLGNLPAGEYLELIDMNNLSNGLYMVRVITSGEVLTTSVSK